MLTITLNISNHLTSFSFCCAIHTPLPVCVISELVRAERVMMSAVTGQYYSEVMRYVPSWLCEPEFYGSQNIDSKGDLQCVGVCGVLLSNTAPCCMPRC